MVQRPPDGTPTPPRRRLLRRRRLLLGDAGKRRVVLVELRRRTQGLVGHLGARVAGRRAVLRHVLLPLDPALFGHACAPTRSSAGAPHSCRTVGTATEPSSRVPFSRIAIMWRHVTAVPFSVATKRGPPPPAGR